MDQPTDGLTKRGVESRSARQKHGTKRGFACGKLSRYSGDSVLLRDFWGLAILVSKIESPLNCIHSFIKDSLC